MTQRSFQCWVAAVGAIGSLAFGGDPPATTQPADAARAALQRLAPLVGHTYTAAFPGDRGLTDTMRFETMLDGKFIRSVHVVRDASGQPVYRGETVYGFDLRRQQLFFTYFNVTGGVIHGVGVVADDIIVWTGENHADGGQPQRTRSELAQVSADGFQMTSFFERDGAWEQRFTLEFRRVAPADEGAPVGLPAPHGS